MTALAAVAVAVAVASWIRPGGGGLERWCCEPSPRRDARVPLRVMAWLIGVAAIVVAGAMGGARGAVLLGVVVLVLGTASILVTWHLGRRRRSAERKEVAWAGEVLAGLLRAGHVPATALDAAASETVVLREAADAQAVGGEVSDALRRASERPGREGLFDLGCAWAVAARTGASLCDAVEATAEQLSARQEVAGIVEAELAAPRTTGRVMAALPAVGLMLGFAFGGNPIAFLLDSPAGWACLVTGVALACAGVLWTGALADRAAGD